MSEIDHRAAMIGFASDLRAAMISLGLNLRATMTGLGVESPGCNDRSETSCRWYVPLYETIKNHSLRRALHLTFASGYLPA